MSLKGCGTSVASAAGSFTRKRASLLEDIRSCRLVYRYSRFRTACCLHFQGSPILCRDFRRRVDVSLKDISGLNAIFISNAIRISNCLLYLNEI
jgi:hypothetical protein